METQIDDLMNFITPCDIHWNVRPGFKGQSMRHLITFKQDFLTILWIAIYLATHSDGSNLKL